MRTLKEMNKLMKDVDESLLNDGFVKLIDYLGVPIHIIGQNRELMGMRKLLIWIIEPKPKKKKESNNHNLKEYGLPENAGIKKN